MSPELPAILRSAFAGSSASGLCVAFSGGPDSTALLHALAQLPEARERDLRALHIDHGLHAASGAWAQHCAAFCKTLDVPLTTVRVEVGDARSEGIEAAARRARHAAFAEHLRDGEWLALAHHRDDQVETVLLKLLRGAGPEGLGGMRARRPLGRGFLWRPLLETPRETLHKYLTENGLSWINDPANQNPRFARNALRSEILPRIARHWPHADASILHSARLCRAASGYIDDEVQTALAPLQRENDTLDAAGWLKLPDALRGPVLDAWLRAHQLPVPPDASRAELERQAAVAAEDRVPAVTWAGAEVRVWEGRLHAMPPWTAPMDGWHAPWDGSPMALPAGCGTLALHPWNQRTSHADAARFEPPLTVRLRQGGERLKPVGDAYTRELRDLFQRARIPPWQRACCPLIYAQDQLLAVADLWTTARGKALFDAQGVKVHWSPSWKSERAHDS